MERGPQACLRRGGRDTSAGCDNVLHSEGTREEWVRLMLLVSSGTQQLAKWIYMSVHITHIRPVGILSGSLHLGILRSTDPPSRCNGCVHCRHSPIQPPMIVSSLGCGRCWRPRSTAPALLGRCPSPTKSGKPSRLLGVRGRQCMCRACRTGAEPQAPLVMLAAIRV